MGTYTTNYNLFLPTIGEQGWGDLVNGNFTTIDTTMAGLNTRIRTLEIETNAIKQKTDAITVDDNVVEGEFHGNFNGNLTGRINLYNSATDGDVKLFDMTFDNPSEASKKPSTTTLTCNPATLTNTYNTSAFNFVGTPFVISTCTITSVVSVSTLAGATASLNVSVVDNTTNETVLSKTLSKSNMSSQSSVTLSCTFSRASNTTYTITITCGGSMLQYQNYFTYNVTTNTPVGIGYLV